MAAKRNRIAAALAYVDEKAKRLTSLDQPKESDAVDMALEMGGSFIPGVGQALAARDFERARRAGDEAGMGMAAASALPVGRLIGALKGYDPVMREIDVYHGSPHRFEEFDASKIGTGEGAQAYGHGIYLAENPDVAKGYQKQLAQIKPEMTVEFGLPISGKSKKFAETALQSSSGDVDSAIKNLKENLQFYSSVEAKNAASEAINALKTAKITWGKDYPVGHFYTADLPDEMVDRMLDWDKPLSEQPAAVRETVMRYMNVGDKQLPADMRVGQVGDKYVVLQDKPPLPGSTFGIGRSVVRGPKAASEQQAIDAYWNSLTGKDFYDTIGKDLGKNADASDYMRQLGIPGIKYLDAGSRGQGGSGTRNFVVFPGEEKKVKILKRE